MLILKDKRNILWLLLFKLKQNAILNEMIKIELISIYAGKIHFSLVETEQFFVTNLIELNSFIVNYSTDCKKFILLEIDNNINFIFFIIQNQRNMNQI